jgi:hypothetical protein
MKKSAVELLKEYRSIIEKTEELVDDWCGDCYGENPQMSHCQTCKGTGTNPNRKVRPTNKKKVEEGRFDVNVKGMPRFTMVDRTAINNFLTKRGFIDTTEPNETDVTTYVANNLNLKIHLYTDDDFWTIEDTNQSDDILDDGTGIRNLSNAVSKLVKAAKGIHESTSEDQEKELETLRNKLNLKSVKFNTCDECDGEGCDKCDYTGKYAVGVNSQHYD